MLSYFDEKEASIQLIEEEYGSLKAERERLLEEIKIEQQKNIKKETKKCRVQVEPIFQLKKINLIHSLSNSLPLINKSQVYKEPEDYPFFRENIITHERIKNALKKIIKEKQYKANQAHLEYKKIYKDYMSQWKEYVRHKEEEEATEQYFASKRYLIEQQYGDRMCRSRRSKESTKIYQQNNNHILKKEQNNRRYEKERFESNRADIPTMVNFLPHSFEKKAYQFIDNNGYIENPVEIENMYKRDNPWSKEEEECLVKLFDLYRKDFKTISSFIPTKSMKDIIWYYYVKKYDLGLKLTYEDELDTSESVLKHTKESEVYVMTKPSFDELYDEEVDITGTSSSEEENEDVDIVGDVDINIPPVEHMNINFNDDKMNIFNNTIKVDIKQDEFVEKNGNMTKTKSHWNEEEKKLFMEHLRIHGKNWDKIASIIKTKTSNQVKNYFQNYRIKLNLYELLPEDQRSKNRKKKITDGMS